MAKQKLAADTECQQGTTARDARSCFDRLAQLPIHWPRSHAASEDTTMKARPFMADLVCKTACSALLLLCACSSSRTYSVLKDHPQHAAEHGQDEAVVQIIQQLGVMRREMADMRSERPQAHPVSFSPLHRRDALNRDKAWRVQQLRTANIEAAFRNEKVNARWSRATEEILRSAFDRGDEMLRGQVRGIECRSQSCRIEIDDRATASLQKSLPFIAEHLAPTLPNMTAAQSTQSPTTLLYFSRSWETA
jgi:hypothetical protein